MEIVHDIRSQKPLRPTHWSLLLDILQPRMGLHRENNFFFKFFFLFILYTVGKLIEIWTKNNKGVGSEIDW